MDTAKVIIQLVTALTNLIVAAFEEKDVAKLRRVTDVLSPSDSVLAARAIMELEKEKARQAFEAAAASRPVSLHYPSTPVPPSPSDSNAD